MSESADFYRGMQQALDLIDEVTVNRIKHIKDMAPLCFWSEWSEGAAYGREDELEELQDDIKGLREVFRSDL